MSQTRSGLVGEAGGSDAENGVWDGALRVGKNVSPVVK